MRLLIITLTIVLSGSFSFATNSSGISPTAGRRLLFHWGSADSNRQILEAAGPSGEISEGLMSLLRHWYSTTMSDVGGQGLYVSLDPTDSLSFGNDLLVLEVDAAALSTVINSPNFKVKNDEALAHSKLDELPLLVNYKQYWLVIPRSPHAGESQLRLRSSSESDALLLWKSLDQRVPGHKLLQLLSMARAVNEKSQNYFTPGPSLGNYPLTAHSRELFLKLLLTEGFRFMVNVNISADPLATYSDGMREREDFNFDIFEYLLEEMLATPLSDAKKSVLLSRWMEEALIKGRRLQSLEKLFPILKAFAESGSANMIKPLFLKMLPLHKFHIGIDSWIQIFGKVSPLLTSEERKNAFVSLARGLLAKDVSFSDPHTAIGNIKTMFGSETLIKNMERFLRLGRANSVGKPGVSITSFYSDFTTQVFDISPAHLSEVIALIMKIEDEAEIENQNRRNEYRVVVYRAEFPIYFMTVAKLMIGIKDETAKISLRAKLGSLLKASHPSLRKGASGFLQMSYFKNGVASSLTETQIESLLNSVLTELPTLAPYYHYYFSEALNGKASLRVAWTELAQRALQITEAQYGQTTLIETLLGSLPIHFQNSLGYVENQPLNRDLVEPLILNIGHSYSYSTISRSLLFIDPLFVSEDLRVNNAKQPYLRFNEAYTYPDGEATHQPAWASFNYAWDFNAINISSSGKGPGDDLVRLNDLVMAQNVEGLTARRDENWNRNKYETDIPTSFWDSYVSPTTREKLSRFFNIERHQEKEVLKFRSLDELVVSIPGLKKTFRDYRRDLEIQANRNSAFSSAAPKVNDLAVLVRFLVGLKNSISDPVLRASTLLYNFTKLHPFENGNGRLARLWVAQLLMASGYDMPIGLPTNDFPISPTRAYWEVRKAIHLGKLWKAFMVDAAQKNLSEAEIFQKEFRGSALEGLIHISPLDDREFVLYVKWLELQAGPPEWAAQFAKQVEMRLLEMNRSGSSVAKITEVERALLLNEIWMHFKNPSMTEIKVSCPALF